MTEKTEYIKGSIDILEARDELNADELAVLCNLKKFMHQSDHQPPFAVGEYYVSRAGIIYLITDVLSDKKAYIKSLIDGELSDSFIKADDVLFRYSTPATAEQIATFKRAEQFAAKGRKLDEFRVGDLVNCSELPFDNGYYTGEVVIHGFGKKNFVAGLKNGLHLYNLDDLNKVTLIQTAEELQEVEHEN